ncbi:hypothetical protein KX816_07470 [Sphingosinicellaceae bacterium]|nr:hypothetical protein KX816_07470 [Sphingosinicellaceae bacterium]
MSVRVLRPVDLTSFKASWEGLTLDRPDARVAAPPANPQRLEISSPPRLIAADGPGHLIIEFAFQHVAEFATEDDKPTPDLQPPVPARAANPSKLVYAVPKGTEIAFTIEGLLEAMGSLELEVAPVATAAPDFTFLPNVITIGDQGSLIGKLLTGAKTRGVDQIAVGRLADENAATRFRGRGAVGLVEAQRALVAANRLIRSRILTAPGRIFTPGPVADGAVANSGQVFQPGQALDPGQVFVPGPLVPGPVVTVTPRPHKPLVHETAIEAPFRLILSPSVRGAWAHARKPVGAAPDDRARVELWHSRLAVRSHGVLDELDDDQRIVRAIWTRDRDGFLPPNPFNSLPIAADRERIVKQTSGSDDAPTVTPPPVRARRLALSALGAWLDLHVQFPTADRYPQGFGPMTSWDQISPMGRDQYVRIVDPGYLYPLGHAAYLVRIMWRKVVDTPPQAALFKRVFIVLGDPDRSFSRRDLPFVKAHVGPLRTPDLKEPPGGESARFFWPTAVGALEPLNWHVDASDHDGAIIHLNAPLLFVRAAVGVTQAEIDTETNAHVDRMTIDGYGQTVAFAPALAEAQATLGSAGARASAEAASLDWKGVAGKVSSEPFMVRARVVIPAIQRLTPGAAPEAATYPQAYKDHGFDAGNAGNVFLALDNTTALKFGSSEHSGGFIQPDVAVGGLARSTGLVADVDKAVLGNFDPAKLFSAGLPKLFGLFSLADLIPGGPLALAPKFVTEQLDRVSSLLHDLDGLAKALADIAAGPDPAVQAAVTNLPGEIASLQAGVQNLLGGSGPPASEALDAIKTQLTQIGGEVLTVADAAPGLNLAPFARAQFDRLLAALRPALDAAKLIDLLGAIAQFAQGLDPGGGEFRTHLEWKTVLNSSPILTFNDPLVLSVDARASAGHAAGIEVAAQLTNFHLNLLPDAPLMQLTFDRIAFRAGGSRKPEIDVVFGDIKFVGLLGFIEVLKDVIPLDGFSDPPFVDISAEGISAGFTLAIPNVAIGVFSLTNISLGADARVPFLGPSISVGFNFCTRERPFTLAVFPLGGGGFVGLRLDPDGMILLEMSLEFGAVVALDFGVASGSISAMGGVYIKLEGPGGSLTGYFRIRGEVDVLSLISASIELYMALTYAFDTGKMIGEATLTIHVSVLFFSTSVSIHVRRTFAGSNGDPTGRDVLLPDGATESETWNLYCGAFADEAEA